MSSSPAPATSRNRRDITRKNALDMVRSLGLILIVVMVVYALIPRPDTSVRPTANVPQAAEAARSAGDVPVIVPQAPNGWHANSAQRSPARDGQAPYWHLGYLTPDEEYVGLDATERASEGWLEKITMEGENVRTPVDIDGVEWDTWISPKQSGRLSLVRGGNGQRTVIVSGTAGRDELAELAKAVQTADTP